MLTTRTPARRITAAAVGALALISLASCGSSGSDTSSDDKDKKETTTTVAEDTSTTSAMDPAEEDAKEAAAAITKRFDETVQQDLIDVGCSPGAVDGIIGPETDAAIEAFQKASGLEVDGELGPETEAALAKAVADGTKVCDKPATTTTTEATTTTTTEAKTTTTQAGSTTTTTTPSKGPKCTATAILAALPDGAQLKSYVCADGWAAGTLQDGDQFILQAEGSNWAKPAQDPCGSASAGLPPIILEDGCPS